MVGAGPVPGGAGGVAVGSVDLAGECAVSSAGPLDLRVRWADDGVARGLADAVGGAVGDEPDGRLPPLPSTEVEPTVGPSARGRDGAPGVGFSCTVRLMFTGYGAPTRIRSTGSVVATNSSPAPMPDGSVGLWYVPPPGLSRLSGVVDERNAQWTRRCAEQVLRGIRRTLCLRGATSQRQEGTHGNRRNQYECAWCA